MSAPQPDVLIAGGGIAGLAAGAILANRGFTVTVLEKSDRVGGKVRVVPFDGYQIPMGPHMYPSEQLETVGRLAGIDLPLIEVRGHAYRFFNTVTGREYDFLHSADEPIATRMERLNLSREDFDHLQAVVSDLDPDVWQGKTVAEWVDDSDFPPRTKQLLLKMGCWATENMLDASEISMDLFSMGVFSLVMGGRVDWTEYANDQSLPEALARRIEEKGGAVLVCNEVQGALIERGRCRGLIVKDLREENTRCLDAPLYVWNIPLYEALQQGILDAARFPERWVKGGMAIEPHVCGYVLHWYGLRERVIDFTGGIYCFGEEVETGAHIQNLGLVAAYSNDVPSTAPSGKQLAFVYTYIEPAVKRDWKAIAERGAQGERLINQYFSAKGYPPVDQISEFKKSSIYRYSWNPYVYSRFRSEMPEIDDSGIENLFFVGHSVRSEMGRFGVDAAAETAVRLCEKIVAKGSR